MTRNALEDDLMINMGEPLILAIGTFVGFVSIVLASPSGYERVSNVDGREYIISRWTGRVSACNSNADVRKYR